MLPAKPQRNITGVIAMWNGSKGYGFIKRDDGGADVFVHIREVDGNVDELRAGQRVRFEPGINPRNGKTEALNVTLNE